MPGFGAGVAALEDQLVLVSRVPVGLGVGVGLGQGNGHASDAPQDGGAMRREDAADATVCEAADQEKTRALRPLGETIGEFGACSDSNDENRL